MKIIFLSATKLGSNTANIFNFFKINLHFDTSNYIKSTYRKLHLVLIGLHSQKIAKKTLTDQSALQVFLLCPKRNNSQTLNRSSCKCFFLQCIYYATTWKKLFFIKIIVTLKGFFNHHVVGFFERGSETSPCFMLSPQ